VFLRSSYPFEFRACGIPKISRRQVWQLASLNPFEFRACGISHDGEAQGLTATS